LNPEYIFLAPNGPLPEITGGAPFRAAVLIESPVETEWQWEVSKWLVKSGCLYMVAWGIECSSWDDSVDYAAMEKFDYGDVPDAEFVMTTWHENEPMSDALFYLRCNAIHPVTDTSKTLILHIAHEAREREILYAYEHSVV
jgi:hypothetical protein